MLKSLSREDIYYNEKPRKLIKINIEQDEHYNQYKGEFLEVEPKSLYQSHHDQLENSKEIKFKDFEEQYTRNTDIFKNIKVGSIKVRKIADTIPSNKAKNIQKNIKPSQGENSIKIQHKAESKSTQKPTQNIQKVLPKSNLNITGLKNWQKFKDNNKNLKVVQNSKKDVHEYIALDCQFVKHNEQQLLARISIVSQNGSCLLDSYVRPDKIITDYVKDISGITYAHIRNAPTAQVVIDKAKKILYNKIIIGHTVWKDLEVCGLKTWKGSKYIIDISEYNDFKQKNGKLISLKNLAFRNLSKKIQDGSHSSVEDASATMNLFKLRKKEILKQFKIIL